MLSRCGMRPLPCKSEPQHLSYREKLLAKERSAFGITGSLQYSQIFISSKQRNISLFVSYILFSKGLVHPPPAYVYRAFVSVSALQNAVQGTWCVAGFQLQLLLLIASYLWYTLGVAKRLSQLGFTLGVTVTYF